MDIFHIQANDLFNFRGNALRFGLRQVNFVETGGHRGSGVLPFRLNEDQRPYGDIEVALGGSVGQKRSIGRGVDGVESPFLGADEGRALNQRYRGRDAPTNVLAFPAEVLPGLPPDALGELGDLVVCMPVLQLQSSQQ